MMPAAKCVTAMPEDKLSSVVTSLVNEKIGCVVVVDPAAERAVGIVTKQDVNRMFLNQVRTGFVVVTDTERLRRDAAAPRGFRGGASRPTVPSRPRPRPRRPRPRARTKASARRVRGERTKASARRVRGERTTTARLFLEEKRRAFLQTTFFLSLLTRDDVFTLHAF
jgi:hypothetical protein